MEVKEAVLPPTDRLPAATVDSVCEIRASRHIQTFKHIQNCQTFDVTTWRLDRVCGSKIQTFKYWKVSTLKHSNIRITGR